MFTHLPCQLQAVREKQMAFDGIFDMYAVELCCPERDRHARVGMYGEDMRRDYVEGESIVTKAALDELCQSCQILLEYPVHKKLT